MDVEFLKAHQLDNRYLKVAETYFNPVLAWLIVQTQQRSRPLLVGINGAQGSGKSTLADYWVHCCSQQGLQACAVSIDDFYLTQVQRRELAQRVHPLLATRGVPGTHDVVQAQACFEALRASQMPVTIPRFDKAIDDPFPKTQWQTLSKPLDIVFFEGWCVGSLAQSPAELSAPLNALEAEEDDQCLWRTYVNAQLAGPYWHLFSLLDVLVMLKAPSFKCVAQWRWEQEQKLRARLVGTDPSLQTGLMSEEEVRRFVTFYERITEVNLERLPSVADVVFSLTDDRTISSIGGRCVRAGVEGEFVLNGQ